MHSRSIVYCRCRSHPKSSDCIGDNYARSPLVKLEGLGCQATIWKARS